MKGNRKLKKVEISELTEDLLCQILRRVSDPGDRKWVSEVCKQWFALEGLTRRSLCLLKISPLRKVLPRFPNLVTFQTSVSISKEADLEFIAQTCPKLKAINLYGEGSLPKNGLYGLSSGGGLPKLSKVSVRGRSCVGIERWLDRFPNLTYLDLGRCWGVDDNAVEAIGLLCTCLRYLNLEHADISDDGLRLLAHGRCSKTLKTLVLARCYDITDLGLSHLQNMQCLEELDLESCGDEDTDVTDTGVIAAISSNRSLKKLNLGRLTDVSDQSMVYVAGNCPNLEILDLTGCSNVTGAGVRAFSGHRCLESLVLRDCGEFYWSDIGHMVLGCKSLKSMVLSTPPMNDSVPESISRIVTLIHEW
ncbi:PREDICTED: F-box protein SKP2B-like [Fragaria vesca subsp. vesca]|uniref:F-box protein SKP2B-like n=1 Tax=Fragaria vesca subsp. vesca TaxID=101020 RepID=UPI0002C30926|nr:PREDICTED: F-box protein SKP2B-like [Fragaria vesca subsp. vesca]